MQRLEKHWEPLFKSQILKSSSADDPAHDILHFERVVKTAKQICTAENAKVAVVVPAAWLHDFINIPKNDPRRSKASQLSAEAALTFLRSIEYPTEHLDEISHAIMAHSFSANITPETLEAKIVQDADRLDGLGAIGVARVFATAGILKRPFYSGQDPFCKTREPNDAEFTIDHFYKKLFKTAETLQTATGRAEGKVRVERMKSYLDHLANEL